VSNLILLIELLIEPPKNFKCHCHPF